jgi:hypothetical protein
MTPSEAIEKEIEKGKKDDAQKAREEAKRPSDEFDLELARLRGKRDARWPSAFCPNRSQRK